jgi:hypothetical protein
VISTPTSPTHAITFYRPYIEFALTFLHTFVQNPYSMGDINPDIAEHIPGKDNDRKTPRGELNWIFTAITDTIAWNMV